MLKSVYLIRDTDGNVKIGVSNNPHSRIKTLHVGNSSNIELLFISKPVYNAPKIEHMLHKKYARQHVSGEWFKIGNTSTLIKQIEDYIKVYGKFEEEKDLRGQKTLDAMKAHLAYLNNKADKIRDKAKAEKENNDCAFSFCRCISGAIPEEESNYTKLIYKTIFCKSLEELKTDFGVKPKESIREYMTADQLQEVESLEMLISGLINIGKGYQEIKKFIEENYHNSQLVA